MSDALPNSIAAYLRRVAVRARRREMLAAMLWAMAVFAAWALAACAIDRYVHLTAAARIAMLAGGAAIAVGVLLWPIRTWGRATDWVAVAAIVESHRPVFGQRLVTVTSRLLGPGEHRGSGAMIAELLAEVEELIAEDRSPVAAAGMRRLGWPVAACAAVIFAAAGMLRVPGMELPRLAARFALPWRAVPAVTTTRLIVSPHGDSEIWGTQPAELRVDVIADRLGDGVVSLFTQSADEPGAPWSRLTMDQLSPERFEYVFDGIDRDLRYYITGGDAVSPVYSVRLLRRPAVAAFRIHYRYPAYVRRSAATVVNTDGLIEAPVGTQAELTITATEPLQSAALRLGSQTLAMTPTADPLEFAATIPVEKDQPYALEMISDRQVAGSGPASAGAMRIHALANRPPALRLTDANGEPGAMLSVDPRQVLPVAFEAEDDYGLSAMSLRWQINDGAGHHKGELPVAIPDGARRIEDAVDFDLASLPLRVGDVLTVWLQVRDTGGKQAVSPPIEALMAARPVDAQMRQRLAALDAAAGFADRLADHLAAAQPKPPSTQPNADPGIESEAMGAALSSATEDAGLLRQSLLRAIAQGAPGHSAIALAGWVDDATVQSYWADRLFRELGDQAALDPADRIKLSDLGSSAASLRDQLQAIDQGLWAQAALDELENVKNANQASSVLARVRQDAADDAKSAGCDTGPGMASELAVKVESAKNIMGLHWTVDFVPAAKQWAQEVADDPHIQPSLSPRLRSAAEAEALRLRGDLSAARDLELASRAAEALEAMAMQRAASASPPAELQEFVAALSALQYERRIGEHAVRRAPSELQAMHQAAAAARQQMDRWARMSDEPSAGVASASHVAASPRAAARSAESAALAAAAHSAGHHPAATTRPGTPAIAATPFPAAPISPAHVQGNVTVAQKLATAQQLDDIGQRQQDLLRQTSVAAPAEAPTLAQRQQQVADSIATVAAGHEPAAIGGDDGGADNWRQREAAALLAVGQQLAEMPQQLATAQDALSDAIAATAHADAAKAELAKLSGGPKTAASGELARAAGRAAQQSSADAADAGRRLAELTGPVSAEAARQIAQRLAPFVQDTTAAQSAIADQLAAALADFERATRGRDAVAADTAAAAARLAIGAAESALADAQNALSDRDPLVTASSSARAAVASLRRSPPDFSTAVRHQTQVTLSLSRAWDQSIHGAAAQRLAAVPGLQPLFASSAGPAAAGIGEPDTPLAEQVAQGRQWGRLQGQGTGASGGSAGNNADPPGFEDALRLYFEALGKAQKEGK